jgi:hypothetical protein
MDSHMTKRTNIRSSGSHPCDVCGAPGAIIVSEADLTEVRCDTHLWEYGFCSGPVEESA